MNKFDFEKDVPKINKKLYHSEDSFKLPVEAVVRNLLKKAWIHCWKKFNDTYYKGEPMSGIYIKTDTMTDDEIFKIIKGDFNNWIAKL